MTNRAIVVAMLITVSAAAQDAAPQRNLYWGDTHLHTNNSADAFVLKNRSATPDTAYRWAKGLPVIHPYSRVRIQIGTPLDFLMVSDHAEALGSIRHIFEGDERVSKTLLGQALLNAAKTDTEDTVFAQLVAMVNADNPAQASGNAGGDPQDRLDIAISTWSENIDAAERYYEPGVFTTLIGWEWTPAPGGANLHRNIMMREGGDIAKQFVPYSALDSNRPENLWAWLDETAERTGANFIAIPHNANISKGLMFALSDSDGNPIAAEYARMRQRIERVVEATQIKGDSETHPRLSPNDEFADYETYEFLIHSGGGTSPPADPGSYVRTALTRGLAVEADTGVNPYKFGVIGSTDAHTSVSSAEEDNFWGKTARDSIPENKESEGLLGARGVDMGAAGLAAVWAEENTREAIFDAFQRREVYATTGPRIQLRFFGGWNFESADASAKDIAAAGYSKGVPMGSDLAPGDGAPSFLVHAAKDPVGGNLDRIQIVKGWIDANGEAQESIYNVALSDGRKEKNGVAPPVGNTVDLETARYTNDIGDVQLAGVWRDPEFDPNVSAVYYVRVLQIPTPRHTLYDAIALNRPHPEGYPPTIQERAYSSPIWYTPADGS